MKQVVKNYAINSSAKTITFTDFSTNPIVLERLYLITDVTTQTILYQFNTTSGVSASSNVLTFTSLSGVGNSDKLQIIYDTQAGDPVYDLPLAKISDGTNTASILKADGTAAGQNAQVIAPTFLSQSFSATSVTTSASVDAGNYRWVSIQVNSQYVGTSPAITPQISNDNSTWVNLSVFASTNTLASGVSQSITGTGVFSGPLQGRYFRLSFSGAYSSGTAAGTVVFSSLASVASPAGVTAVGSNSTTGGAVPTNAFYIGAADGSGNLSGLVKVGGASDSTTNPVAAGSYAFNGTNWDRQRTANSAANTTGTGLLGAGNLGFDGTNWQSVGVAPANASTTGVSGNSLLTAGSGFTTSTLTLNSSTPNSAWFDMLNYAWVSVEILTNTTPATLTFQVSGDSSQSLVNNTGMQLTSAGTNAAPTTSTTATSGIYHGMRTGRWFRVSSNNGAGTTTLAITFFTHASSINTFTNVVASFTTTGSAVPASAFYKGLLAQTNNPTAATAGNLVGALSDKLGKQVVVGSIRDLKVQQSTTITSSTAETTVLTAVASVFLDVYGVIVSNTSATAVDVSFKDSTGGTTRFDIQVPAGDTRTLTLNESAAITQATVNNNWTATCSASVASVKITMLAVKNT